MLTLLKEFGELPGSNFEIRFVKGYEYTPSLVADRIYDLYSYAEDLETMKIGDSTVSRYSYIRGRLPDKIVKALKHGGEIKRTDFIWKGNKLMKREFVVGKTKVR